MSKKRAVVINIKNLGDGTEFDMRAVKDPEQDGLVVIEGAESALVVAENLIISQSDGSALATYKYRPGDLCTITKFMPNNETWGG